MERRNLKDAQKRAIFARLEHTRIMLRALLKDRSLPQSVRFHMSMELNTLPRKSTKTKINNRCVSTGRAKGVYRLFKCSRICMRELVAMGALPGVKKASW
jgi:small subunit ribosomal protein S14|tara:strand:+ start:6969 stop:7268 length:300 start_codon:yes stop_codon:yes gene_type:complete